VPKTSTSGQGRRKGVPNKLNADLKAMILGALDDAGGREYLAARAIDTPVAFMSLLGKVLPMQLTGENGGALAIDFRWLDAPDPSLESPALLMIDAEVDD
jgi:hypothetical protein